MALGSHSVMRPMGQCPHTLLPLPQLTVTIMHPGSRMQGPRIAGDGTGVEDRQQPQL